MNTGLVPDRKIVCGDGCTFTVGHAFGCGYEQAQPEALAFWCYGWRENLNADVLAQYSEKYPYLAPTKWETKGEVTEKVLERLSEMLNGPGEEYRGLPGWDYQTNRNAAIRSGTEDGTVFGPDAEAFWLVEEFTGSPTAARELLTDGEFRRRWQATIAANAEAAS